MRDRTSLPYGHKAVDSIKETEKEERQALIQANTLIARGDKLPKFHKPPKRRNDLIKTRPIEKESDNDSIIPSLSNSSQTTLDAYLCGAPQLKRAKVEV